MKTLFEILLPFRWSASLLLGAASLLTPFSGQLRGDQLYTYTGSAFNSFPSGSACPPTCSVIGLFDVAQALAPNLSALSITPISYSISAGGTTLVSTDPGNFTLLITTDVTGAISAWVWQVIGPAGSPSTRIVSEEVSGSIFDDLRVGNNPPPVVGPIVAVVYNNPGIWSSAAVSSSPEPGTVLLLSGGLLVLAVLRRVFFCCSPERDPGPYTEHKDVQR